MAKPTNDEREIKFCSSHWTPRVAYASTKWAIANSRKEERLVSKTAVSKKSSFIWVDTCNIHRYFILYTFWFLDMISIVHLIET